MTQSLRAGPAAPAVGPLLRLLRSIRPLEWVLLAFLVFVAIKAGQQALVEWRGVIWLRTRTIFFSLGLVEVVHLIRQFQTPWPGGTTTVRRLHWALFPFAISPMLLGVLLGARSSVLVGELPHATAAQSMTVLVTVSLHIVGLGLPTLVLWLLAGLDVKQHAGLDARRFLGSTGRFFGRTLRDWAPILVLLAGYWWSSTAADAQVHGRDALMQSIDRVLFFGHDPLDLLESVIWQPLTEWLAFAYSFYAVLFPLALGAVLLKSGRAALQEAVFALGAAFFLAYVLYALVPVKGPVLFRDFSVPLEMYLAAPLKEALMDATRTTWDCFPSMHTCGTVLMSWALWRSARRVFWVVLPLTASIPVACVYLRYHYVIDVIAGLALAAAIVALTRKLRPAIVAAVDARDGAA